MDNNNSFKKAYLSYNKLNNYEKYIGIVILVVLTVIAVLRGSSTNYTGDFHVFWLAGKNFYSGNQVYLTNTGLQFLYPPFAAVLFGLFAMFPLKVAAIIFSLINIVLWITCFYNSKLIIEHFLKIKINSLTLLLTFIFTLNFYTANLNLVQVNLVLFYLTLLFIKYYIKEKYFFAGLFLAAAICFKVTPIVFLAWLFMRANFKVLFYTLISMGAFVAIPLLMRGVGLGIEDMKLFYATMADAASRASTSAYSNSRSLKSALSNYLLSFENISDHFKHLIIVYTPLLLGFTYILWLGILRQRKIAQKFFDLSATFILILLVSVESGDAHMVSLALPLMALLAIGLKDDNKKYKYLIFGIGLSFIMSIGESLSYLLLDRLCIYTLSMLVLYFLHINFSFRPTFQNVSNKPSSGSHLSH